MQAKPTIAFLRHGQTDWNVEGRLQGQQDVPLNDNGRRQARRNGETIAGAIPGVAGFDFIASPLKRARETMEIARGALGLDPTDYRTDDRLREITFGDWEGFTTAEIRRHDPALLAAREANKWNFLPPGGESYQMLSDRIVAWLEGIDRPTVVVAHGGVGRVARAHLLGLDKAGSVAEDFPHDRVFLWREGKGEWL